MGREPVKIKVPYGHGLMEADILKDRIAAILEVSPPSGMKALPEPDIVLDALANPVGSERLSAMAIGKKHILLIISDHTRPVPSKITLPLLLSEIRSVNPHAVIKILVATGCHRACSYLEMIDKFGQDIVSREDIIIHDAANKEGMTFLGMLPSGGQLHVNNLVMWADLVVSEGFIEPHFFAGYSGGRKSILPGIAYEKTVMYNHNAAFIAHPNARAGVLDSNPIHRDMAIAAKAARLAFILNVVLDSGKRIIKAFSGDPEAAHLEGCRFVASQFQKESVPSDIVITSNGGYPLDQNLYQAVKGMTTAESCLNPGGVIIIAASCTDGHGGDAFFRWLKDADSPQQALDRITAIPAKDTLPDQWQAQILARVLIKASAVIVVSRHIDPQIVSSMHMLHADSLEKAMKMADSIAGTDSKITVIPDGIGIIIK